MTADALVDHGESERYDEALRFCRAILPRVSRTFAIGISHLPGELGVAVVVGYLVCRIADTVEDDGAAPAALRSALLERFLDCFVDAEAAESFGAEAVVISGSEADLEVLSRTADVFVLYRTLPARTREILRQWVTELVRGMRLFVDRYPGGIRIATVAEFREYCYYVAGTVGHLLTDLWREYSPFIGAGSYHRLLSDCEFFGEAQQTVNIVRDIAADAEHENAIYVPARSLAAVGSHHDRLFDPEMLAANRRAIDDLLAVAHAGIDRSLHYICALPVAAYRIRLFCVIPTLLAAATLRELERSDAMLRPGGTVKISRPEVKSLVRVAPAATVSNLAVRSLLRRVRREPFVLRGA